MSSFRSLQRAYDNAVPLEYWDDDCAEIDEDEDDKETTEEEIDNGSVAKDSN